MKRQKRKCLWTLLVLVFVVSLLPAGALAAGETVQVTFSIQGDSIHGETGHTAYEVWVPVTSYTLEAGASVTDLLSAALADTGYTATGADMGYVTAFTKPDGTTLAAYDNGPNSGWLFTVNGAYPIYSMDDMVLEDGDAVVWLYADDYNTLDFAQPEMPAPPFADVGAADWFYQYVAYVYNAGLMEDMGNGLFQPNTEFSRAMLVTILYRMENQPEVTGETPFTDLDTANGTWYLNAVAWAYANQIINGATATTFEPLRAVTREEMAAVLYRYAAYKGYDLTITDDLSGYTDSGLAEPYAQDALAWAVSQGLMNGVGGGLLDPKGDTPRSQAATLIQRLDVFAQAS